MLKKDINTDNNLEEINISQLSDEEIENIIDYLYNIEIQEYISEKRECIFGDVFSKIIAVSFELFLMKELPKTILSSDKTNVIIIALSVIGMLSLIQLNNYYVNLSKELTNEINNLEKCDIKTLTKKIESIQLNRNSNEMYINLK